MDICEKLRQAASLTIGDEQPEWLKPERAYFDMLLEAVSEIERLRAQAEVVHEIFGVCEVVDKTHGMTFREIKQEIKNGV